VSEEQHVALPHLYGAPAYSRPPRPVEELQRPFDMDELPLEADRTEDDVVLLAELMGSTLTPAAIATAKPSRRLRFGRPAAAPAPEEAAPVAVAAGPRPSAASDAPMPALEGRPFRLRSLGRIFGSDEK
jgi:hypothetical protein